MSLSRWDPIGEMMNLREAMDRLFEESFTLGRPLSRQRVFPVDVYEKGDDIIVEADIPGVKPEDVNIQIQGDQLIIDAQSRREQEIERENFFRRERTLQRYFRVIPLPSSVKTDAAEATYENGTLRVRLPKSEEVRARRIEVKGPQKTMEGQAREVSVSGQEGEGQSS